MHTDVILTNKRRTHAQSNYTKQNSKPGLRASYAIHQETEWVYSKPAQPWTKTGGGISKEGHLGNNVYNTGRMAQHHQRPKTT